MLNRTLLGLVAGAVFIPSMAAACAPPAIIFAFGSTRLSADDQAAIQSVADEMRASPDRTLRLIAQTDGSDANMQMASRRARVVKAALIRLGVPAQKIEVRRHKIEFGGKSARLVLLEAKSAPSCS